MLLQTNIFPPMEDAFRTGSLVMPSDVQLSSAGLGHFWSSWPLNSWLIVISALLIAVNIVNFYRIGEHILKGVTRWRWNNTIEASIQVSRTRDTLALLMFIPACLIISRYGIYSADAMQLCPEDWRTGAVIAVSALWVIIRFIICKTLESRMSSVGNFETAHKFDRTFFIALTVLALVCVGACSVAGAEDGTVRSCLALVSGVMYVMFIFNKGQILSSTFHPLGTFLYLCALEIVPLGLLIAANVCL